MKKLLILLLVYCFLFTACSSNNPNNATTADNSANSEAAATSATSSSGVSTQPSGAPGTVGTNAALYNEKLSYLEKSYGPYYAASGESDKVAAYDTSIKMTVSNWYTTTIEKAIAKFGDLYGETYYDNRWSDAMKRLFNIDVEYKWWAADADYNQKLRLDMAANDLPDVFLVREQNDLMQLAESGSIWDLTDMVDKWASNYDKEVWKSDGGALIEMATYNDRLYAIPNSVSDTDNFSYLWIRSDWMDKLNLKNPTTVDELTKVIDAFTKADMDGNGKKDTVGLILDKTLYYPCRGLFSAFEAYPEIWVKTDNGLVWGGTTQTNKNVLAYLANLYKNGYIDPEFITKSGTDAMESLLSGKNGIVYGGHWVAHTIGDLHELDAKAGWRCITLPTGKGNLVKSPLKPSHSGWTAVNSKYKHPETAFKARSLHSYTLKDKDATWWFYEENITWQIGPGVRANVSAFDNLNTYLNLQEAYNNNNDTSLLRAKAIPYWANLHGDLKWEWELMFGPGDKTPMTVLNESKKNNRLFYDAFLGPQSSYMQERWSTIIDEQLIAFTKIIIGEVGVDEGFNAWLKTFSNMGGEKITAEVNEWYKKSSSK